MLYRCHIFRPRKSGDPNPRIIEYCLKAASKRPTTRTALKYTESCATRTCVESDRGYRYTVLVRLLLAQAKVGLNIGLGGALLSKCIGHLNGRFTNSAARGGRQENHPS